MCQQEHIHFNKAVQFSLAWMELFYVKFPFKKTILLLNKSEELLSEKLGSFSISDISKNVTFKMNLYFYLCHVYFNSLKMSNVGKFPWNWFLGDCTQV